MRHLTTGYSIGWQRFSGYFFHDWVGAVQKVLNARPTRGLPLDLYIEWSCAIGARQATVIT